MRPCHCLVTRPQSLTLNKVDYYNGKTYVAFLLRGIIFHKSFKTLSCHVFVDIFLSYIYIEHCVSIYFHCSNKRYNVSHM